MKNLFRYSIRAMIMLFISIGLTSCYHYIDIIAQTSCSPDLLEFVTPVVTITGENGESQSFELSNTDFHETTEGGSITINVSSTTIASTAVNNVAECTKRFNKVESMKGDIKVDYTLKPNVSPNKDKYVFFHGVGYRYKTDLIAIIAQPFKPIGSEVNKEDVGEYLEKLSKNGDSTSFSVSVN